MFLPGLLSGFLPGVMFAALASAKPMPNPQVASRAIVTCGQNEAHNRACWKNRWDINTDYENITPDTGNTRTFDLRITNVTEFAPDGVPRRAMLINNQYPGPAITAGESSFKQGVTSKADLHRLG